jgi:hypothetical protein
MMFRKKKKSDDDILSPVRERKLLSHEILRLRCHSFSDKVLKCLVLYFEAGMLLLRLEDFPSKVN